MSDENNETHAEIIAEACDKYTVHDCNECNWRKCCFLNSRGFDSDECKQKRQSIALLFGIEDGYFTKLLCRLEDAHKREVEKLNSVIQAQRSAFDAEQDRQRREATAKDSLVVGNAAALREALVMVRNLITKGAHEDGIFAVIDRALAAPARNCDVGTPDEQSERFDAHCRKYMGCRACPLRDADGSVPKHCEFRWAQMPYEEGGAV